MWNRYVVAVNGIGCPQANRLRSKMRDDLMAVKIEIDPMRGAPPFRTPKQLAVKSASGGEIVDGKREVKRRQLHSCGLPPGAAPRNDAPR